MPGKLLIINSEGVLVPADDDHAPSPASEAERFLSLAINGGGSGTGMSHYSAAAICGRRARLNYERYQSFEGSQADLPPIAHHFIIGSVYHKLHELARSPGGLTLDMNERWANPNVREGVRLYKGWLRQWGLDYWGKCLGVEVKLEDTSTFHHGEPFDWTDMTKGTDDYMGHRAETAIPVTAALDMVVEMDWAACERAKRRGLDLTPGRRIIDWKTNDKPATGEGITYLQGVQALWYPYAYNLAHPDAPVDGIIFDCINKRGNRKDKSVLESDFQAYYKPAGEEDIEVLRGLVMQGHRNIVEDIPNRASCVDWTGKVCAYRLNGQCDSK